MSDETTTWYDEAKALSKQAEDLSRQGREAAHEAHQAHHKARLLGDEVRAACQKHAKYVERRLRGRLRTMASRVAGTGCGCRVRAGDWASMPSMRDPFHVEVTVAKRRLAPRGKEHLCRLTWTVPLSKMPKGKALTPMLERWVKAAEAVARALVDDQTAAVAGAGDEGQGAA